MTFGFDVLFVSACGVWFSLVISLCIRSIKQIGCEILNIEMINTAVGRSRRFLILLTSFKLK